MNNLTQQYQNYRNQLSGITNVNSQIESIKNTIKDQHIQDWADIKDKWDKATAIGTEASSVLGTFRLGQKFKAGVKAKIEQIKGKVDELKDGADQVVSVAKNKADGVVNQLTDAGEKYQGTMADLAGAGKEAVEASNATMMGAPKESFPMAPAEEMGEMTGEKGGISIGDLAQQFPSEEISRPSIMGGGKFEFGFSGNENPLIGDGVAPREIRGSLPTRGFTDTGVGDRGVSGATHSQPEVDNVSSGEIASVEGDFREKTLGLFGRLREGLFSGKAPIQQEFGSAREVSDELQSAGADLAGDVAKTGSEIGAEATGLATAGAEVAGDVAEGIGGAILGALPGVGEVVGLATAVAGFAGSFASEAKEQLASQQNPLTRTNFAQFNIIPTMNSMASQPTTPGVF